MILNQELFEVVSTTAMIVPKTTEELEVMREGGKKLGTVLAQLLSFVTPGVTLRAIDQKAEELISRAGGTPSFKTVKNYRWATCLCVNEVVVHGIPTEYKLKRGDVLTVDVGMLYRGFHTDTAWTVEVGYFNNIYYHSKRSKEANLGEKQRFLAVGKQALSAAIRQARIGNRIGHISQAIQTTIERAGYSVVRTLVGHGVGTSLHEDPQIPCFVKGSLADSPPLTAGQTLAIEVIYAQGKGAVEYGNDDGWSLGTVDGSLSAVFEHTVAVTPDGPVVLTQGAV